MMTYRYRIYYEWQGSTKSDPFAEEKSPEDLERAFDCFPNELKYRLEDRNATVRLQRVEGKPREAILAISTTESEEKFQKALAATLQDWRLFGAKLKE